MSCFLMRAAASIGLTPISAYILPPPCAAISLTSECVSALTSPKAPMTIPRIGLTVGQAARKCLPSNQFGLSN
ncbi:hypothetical protein T492DRAFT_972596, partial [Pavlovales sp. CCMP2436]